MKNIIILVFKKKKKNRNFQSQEREKKEKRIVKEVDNDSYNLSNESKGHILGPITSLCVCHYQNRLHILFSGGFDGSVILWNMLTANILYSIRDPSHNCPPLSLSLLQTSSPGIVIGYHDGCCCVVEIESAMKLFELYGHERGAPVRSVACTVIPRPFIVTCSIDSKVRIWDLLTASKERNDRELEGYNPEHIREGLERLKWQEVKENKKKDSLEDDDDSDSDG